MKRTPKIVLIMAIIGLLAPAAHASLAEIGTATAPVTEGGYGCSIIDTADGFSAFGSSVPFVSATSTFSAISLVNISPLFGYAGSSKFFNRFTNLNVGVFDASTGFSYWASSGPPSALQAIHLAVPISASSTTFPAGVNAVGTGVIDSANHFAYFGTQTSPSLIVKMRIPDGVSVTSVTYVSSITLPAGLDFLSASVIDSQNGFAYFASSTTTGAVAKIKLSNFTLVSTVTFKSGEGGAASAVIDIQNQFAYFGTHDSPGKVVKVNLSAFLRDSALTFKSGENDLTSAVLDAARGKAYFGTNTSSGMVVQVTCSNLSENTTLTLGSGENFLRSGVIDNDSYAYFGTYTTPGRVVKIDLLAGRPEILLQPASGAVHAGEAAAFFVKADGRNLTYQWQRDGVDISGATASAYSFTAASTDDGAAFLCIVTGANGSTTSSSAQLTVLPVIKVYPNPWRSDLHSGQMIKFEGLLPNSTVKIFNLAAHWVKTLPPASGVATWDRTNDAEQAVASGYYVYLITTGNDKQTVHGMLAIIR